MSKVFPAIYSTLAPQDLVERVLTQYQLGRVNQCLLWNRGLGDVYLVQTTSQDYILKISHHHWRSRSEIQFELEFLDFLHEHQLPVAYPLTTKQGKLFVTINAVEGDRYAALFPYAPGEVPLGDLNITQGKLLGETLGKLHQTSLEFTSTTSRQALNLQYLLDDSWRLISPYLKHRKQDLDYLAAELANIRCQLSFLPQTQPFWAICWGDPHSGNVHLTDDNQITLFDFDQCGYGWRAFDLAKFLQVSLNAGMSRTIRDAFFSGYQTIDSLAEVEINSLKALTKMAHIWQWAISINAAVIHNWSRLDARYFTQRLQRLKVLDSQDWHFD